MSFIWHIKYLFKRRALKRLGLKNVFSNDQVWIEGPGGWRVNLCYGHPREPVVLYCEGNRSVSFDSYNWHESKEDREADTGEMSARELVRHYNRATFRICVPDNLRWSIVQADSPTGSSNASRSELVSSDERDRILANIEMAVEFDVGKKPQFVK